MASKNVSKDNAAKEEEFPFPFKYLIRGLGFKFNKGCTDVRLQWINGEGFAYIRPCVYKNKCMMAMFLESSVEQDLTKLRKLFQEGMPRLVSETKKSCTCLVMAVKKDEDEDDLDDDRIKSWQEYDRKLRMAMEKSCSCRRTVVYRMEDYGKDEDETRVIDITESWTDYQFQEMLAERHPPEMPEGTPDKFTWKGTGCWFDAPSDC